MTVLITGAAGGVARMLVPRLRADHKLRLTDLVAAPDLAGLPVVPGDVADPAFAAEITSGVDAVVHLAGDPRPDATWAAVLRPNVEAAATVLQAAQDNGVRRVVVASSIHAMGGHLHRPPTSPVDARWAPHPCCRYGASKVFVEQAGRVTAESGRTSVVALRLGGCRPHPPADSWLPTWLAPEDLAHLVTRAVEADVHWGVYFGVSANTRSPFDLGVTVDDLGYRPRHDSEAYADTVPAGAGGATCPPARPTRELP